MLQYCLYFYVLVFGHEAHGILAPQPDVEPLALEGEVLATGSPGKPPSPRPKLFILVTTRRQNGSELWGGGFFGATSEASRLDISFNWLFFKVFDNLLT